MATDEPDTPALMIAALEAMLALGESLEPGDWSKPTDCPGWSVQDQFSHQCGLETSILGRDAPYSGTGTQPAVDYRRSWVTEQVLAEFRDLVAARTDALRGVDPAGADEFLKIRVFDCWIHEQDVRCAVDRPGNLTGPVADFVVARCVMSLPMIVGKRVAPPDGTAVVFQLDGEEIAIGMEGTRANRLAWPPANPAATVAFDRHAFTRLAGGRQAPADLDISVSGDRALADKILAGMTLTP